jgi:hypothetical protein
MRHYLIQRMKLQDRMLKVFSKNKSKGQRKEKIKKVPLRIIKTGKMNGILKMTTMQISITIISSNVMR